MSDHDEVNEDAGGAGGDVTAAPEALAVEAQEAADAAAVATAVSTKDDEDDEERAAVAYGWTYLAVLAVIFGVVALLAFSCDSDEVASTTPVATTTVDNAATATESGTAMPVALSFIVADGTVTLTGAVPDEGARRQLVEAAIARYGEGNVIDELEIDEETTLTGGSITTSGSAVDGDTNADDLQAELVSALGLTDGGVDVSFEAAPLVPVDAEAALSAGTVVLTGELPDQEAIDSVTAAAEAVWGAENVDGSGLSIGEVTWAEGQIRVTGSIDAGDTRGDDFAAALAAGVAGAAIETSGLAVDSGPEALARSEAQLEAALQADPILFALGSTEIDPASDEILTRAAAAINAAPGVAVEIVGHTDDQGGEAANETLSANRAEAVLNRLVELSVDAERLTSRGAGESDPIVANDSDENRAKNRRIEFNFGTSA